MIIKRLFLPTILFSSLVVSASALAAGPLVTNATISKINVGTLNSDGVSVYFSGGTGPCTSFVLFYGNYVDNTRMQYILQTALSAFLSGKYVDVYDDVDSGTPTSSSCDYATEIAIHN